MAGSSRHVALQPRRCSVSPGGYEVAAHLEGKGDVLIMLAVRLSGGPQVLAEGGGIPDIGASDSEC